MSKHLVHATRIACAIGLAFGLAACGHTDNEQNKPANGMATPSTSAPAPMNQPAVPSTTPPPGGTMPPAASTAPAGAMMNPPSTSTAAKPSSSGGDGY
ncbi:hypothetical protein [Oleiagrimonas sp. C23AA]|uniref:hypothetical protein n=1 Tax=Oleiagrimonas sp. C23AA TaxID=2719047 RepID=UPI001423E2DB|nr:hypothetical protein [Oleiagrimonas sp. C23AA]NII09454.1 hypothetical protein [Oleiagrimonas sp. C23AA]